MISTKKIPEGQTEASGGGASVKEMLIHATFLVANSIQNIIGFPLTTSAATADSGTGPVGTGFSAWARRRYISSTTAGSSITFNNTSFKHIRTSLGIGTRVIIKFGNDDAALVPNARNFFGINATSTIGNVDPSTLTNCFAIGNDSGDANLHIFHNDGVGTATKIDLGSAFPANTNGVDYYTFEYTIDKITGHIAYSLINNHTGVTAIGTITTDLPESDLMNVVLQRNNGSDALAVRLCVSHHLVYEIL